MAVKHTVRTRDGKEVTFSDLTRGKAIKLFCTECMGYQTSLVRDCTSTKCALYPFRGGTRAAYGDSVEEEEQEESVDEEA